MSEPLLTEELQERAEEAAREQAEPGRPGELATTAGGAVAIGSLSYYLGEQTTVFSDGADGLEIPIVAAFLAISAMVVNDLREDCAQDWKQLVRSSATGAVGGVGVGGAVAALALGLTADILVTGGLGLAGLVVGGLWARRGGTRHACGAKLRCLEPICPRCTYLVKPRQDVSDKDLWDILDVCSYLQTSTRRWNAIKALAFLLFADLLEKGRRLGDSPALWHPTDIRRAALDDRLVARFEARFGDFVEARAESVRQEDRRPWSAKARETLTGWTAFLGRREDAVPGTAQPPHT